MFQPTKLYAQPTSEPYAQFELYAQSTSEVYAQLKTTLNRFEMPAKPGTFFLGQGVLVALIELSVQKGARFIYFNFPSTQ